LYIDLSLQVLGARVFVEPSISRTLFGCMHVTTHKFKGKSLPTTLSDGRGMEGNDERGNGKQKDEERRTAKWEEGKERRKPRETAGKGKERDSEPSTSSIQSITVPKRLSSGANIHKGTWHPDTPCNISVSCS
jgi:hypothetical protein